MSLSLAKLLLFSALRVRLQHPTAFILDRLAQMIGYFSVFAGFWILLHHYTFLAGWNWNELQFLLSFQLLSYALAASATFVQFRSLEDRIKESYFDYLLTLPVNPWLYISLSGINLDYISHVIFATFAIVFAASRLTVAWTPATILETLLFLASSTLVNGAILSSAGSMSLIFRRSRYFFVLAFGMFDLAKYPLHIFPQPFQFVAYFIIPIGLMSSFPVSVLLGKSLPTHTSIAILLCTLGGPFAATAAILCWRWAFRLYQTTGG